jgi:hypothetical protein
MILKGKQNWNIQPDVNKKTSLMNFINSWFKVIKKLREKAISNYQIRKICSLTH